VEYKCGPSDDVKRDSSRKIRKEKDATYLTREDTLSRCRTHETPGKHPSLANQPNLSVSEGMVSLRFGDTGKPRPGRYATTMENFKLQMAREGPGAANPG
jgi:hypothetical protein